LLCWLWLRWLHRLQLWQWHINLERERCYLVIFFLTETRNLHESQFNKQTLI
jgi:hypothetical protein